jgi:hypothetical protein
MKRLFAALASALLWIVPGHAQLGSFGDSPVEVDSEGETRFVGGVAVAERNVVIRYGETTIFCDYAEYNPDTRDVLVKGNVRAYRADQIFTAERALYNFETKVFRAADFRGDFSPMRVAGDTVGTMGPKDYLVRGGIFTTSDNSKPDYHFRAKGVRIYPDDRIVFTRVTLYVGTTPVFWWPYLWQSLKEDQAFTISPGYKSDWGAFLLTTFNYPIAEKISSKFHFDLYADRGVGMGVDVNATFGKGDRSEARFRAYYIADSNPDASDGDDDSDVSDGRYRISLQQRLFITDDIYALIDVNKLSDREYLEDFAEGEFSNDPQPDNVLPVTKLGKNYALSLIVRGQLNEFQQTTERLPELVLDMGRQPLFGTRVYYEGETGIGYLRRAFADDIELPSYDYLRADTFHQLLYPGTYFGWLSFVPRIGMRLTYYSDSGRYADRVESFTVEDLDSLTGETIERLVTETTTVLEEGGSAFRAAFNTGFEASFKMSREWDNAQRLAWGLDGLRHVVQPYTNFSLLWTNLDASDDIYQIDRLIPSTELSPIDLPQFNAIDSLANWSIWRFGVRNRLQTRRDNQTINWLEMDTFFDINLEEPEFPGAYEDGTFSNLNNRLVFRPIPWVNYRFNAQLPMIDDGFTQFNSSLGFMPTRNLHVNVSHRYIEGNPFFRDNNLIGLGAYVRVNDHWGFSFREQYELDEGNLESQRYEVHRDLSSWVASLGFVVRDRRGEDEYGLLLSLALKDIPAVTLPLNFNPQGSDND